MSVHVESWAWKQKVGSPIRKLILVKLAQNADDDGWSWWRQGRMAEECEVSRSTIQAHLSALRGMGLIQVIEQKRENGGRSANRYRVLGGWADKTHARDSGGGAREADKSRPVAGQAPAREADNQGTVSREPSEEKTPPTPPIQPLGRRRFKVPSNTTEDVTYTVDLNTMRCSCQAGKGCRHLASAVEFEEQASTLRRSEMRDALWDVLVEVDGAPTERQSADRGMMVSELAEMLTNDGVEPTPERWAEEVKARHRALVKEWGASRVTLHSFVTNWNLAGRLVRPRPENTEKRERKYTRETPL